MNRLLSSEQVDRYWEDGILFPLPALSLEEVAYYRRRVEELEAAISCRVPKLAITQPQLHFRWAYELAIHPRVVQAVTEVLGPDVLVQSAGVFDKNPGDGKYVAWHQDGYYWHLSAPRLVSAWIALSASTRQSGCLRVIPGTHHSHLPHREQPTDGHMLTSGLTLDQDIDLGRVVDVCLRPGEMSFHHERLVHGSEPNRADDKRIGFAIRYLAADVTQELPHHEVIVASGQPRSDHYRILSDPPTDDIEEGLRRHAEFTEVNRRRRLGAGAR
jgi:ectoine hydroxylase-related dioxygenase (phytanoyl-CoA dioxygenase family)